MKNLATLLLFLAAVLFGGCNTDNVIYDGRGPLPVIVLDSADGRYTVKTGCELTLAPSVENAAGAAYEWILGSESVGSEASHTFVFAEAGIYYATFRVTTSAGAAEEDLSIEAVEPSRPVISLAVPAGGLTVAVGTDCTLQPVIRNSDVAGFRCEWLLDGVKVSEERSYTFRSDETGRFTLTIRAANEDGEDSRDVEIEVVAELPQSVRFAPQSYLQRSTERSVEVGRPIYLKPAVENFTAPRFVWTVDGVQAEANGGLFIFTPEREGLFRVAVTVSDAVRGSSVRAEVDVRCGRAVLRGRSGASRRTQDCVYEYIPAPGQFINETLTGGFTDGITTHEAAAAYAAERMAGDKFVSLGGFGGYMVVGFDHSVVNRGGGSYDFAIQGNAFLSGAGGSNEPGIVWVMQDTNGNGLPDDEWYELRGSASDAEDTLRDYSVTYYRPEGPRMAVQWTDSEGASGTIDYIKAFHRQDFYYPLWIAESSYTLTGTRLSPRNSEDSAGNWHNNAFEWGYADNYGDDNLSGEVGAGGEGQRTGFRISNAMHPDGTPVGLAFIDFVKVQTALNTKSGALGENSTEVYSFTDLSMEE